MYISLSLSLCWSVSVHVSVSVSVYVSAYVSLSVSVCLSLRSSVSVLISLPVSFSLCLSGSTCLCLSACVFCLPACPSVSLPVSVYFHLLILLPCDLLSVLHNVSKLKATSSMQRPCQIAYHPHSARNLGIQATVRRVWTEGLIFATNLAFAFIVEGQQALPDFLPEPQSQALKTAALSP